MYLPSNIEEVTDLLNGLPADVSQVLGLPEETAANRALKERSGLSERKLILLNDFYLTLIAKKNPITDLPNFLVHSIDIEEDVTIHTLLTHFVERLSWYGDYFPNLKQVVETWKVSVPENASKIEAIREALVAEQAKHVPEEHVVPSAERVKLPLLRAASEYPKIGDQQITRERIRIPGRQDDVRDSENGKKLSSEERERLNVIIRSIEENEPVEIDAGRGEIVFPEPRFAERRRHPVPVPPSGNPDGRRDSVLPPRVPGPEVVSRGPVPPVPGGGTVSFSSGHALPVERSRSEGSSVRYGRPPIPSPPLGPAYPSDPDDGRVVDLRG